MCIIPMNVQRWYIVHVHAFGPFFKEKNNHPRTFWRTYNICMCINAWAHSIDFQLIDYDLLIFIAILTTPLAFEYG